MLHRARADRPAHEAGPEKLPGSSKPPKHKAKLKGANVIRVRAEGSSNDAGTVSALVLESKKGELRRWFGKTLKVKLTRSKSSTGNGFLKVGGRALERGAP